MDDIIGTINDKNSNRVDSGGCSDIAFKSPENVIIHYSLVLETQLENVSDLGKH